MKQAASTSILSFFKIYVGVSSLITIAIGIAVMFGWFFDIVPLKGILPGLATMKANTALCFILLGTSLWLQRNEISNWKINFLARVCARSR